MYLDLLHGTFMGEFMGRTYTGRGPASEPGVGDKLTPVMPAAAAGVAAKDAAPGAPAEGAGSRRVTRQRRGALATAG